MSKLRIGVLMGGKSIEKEVSFNTGRTVCDHLDTAEYDIIPLYQTDRYVYLLPWHFLHRGKTTDFEHRLAHEATSIAWDDIRQCVDYLYIAQHGCYAEDGALQGFLEILGIPYLGSGVFASALRADKIMHKYVLHNAGIATPRFVVVEPYEIDNFEQYKNDIEQRLFDADIKNNYVVKPYNEGSSLGVAVVGYDELESALQIASTIEPGRKKRVIIEEKINGMEFTCIILIDYKTGGFIPLPPTESIADAEKGFFCYEQKYMPGRGVKRTPARCSAEITQRIQETCINVMTILELQTMCRIDGFVTEDGKIVIIDPNAFSGISPSSYIVNQAAEINMTPSQILSHIIETDVQRYKINKRMIYHEKFEKSIMKAKIKVAVLLGGASNEKETSLDSGRNIFYKLSPHTYEAIAVFVSSNLELFILTQSQLVRNSTKEIVELLREDQKIKWNDLSRIADFVFNALHGGEGENGYVQGALEMLGLPYNGSSVLASALCMNKYKTNQLLSMHGFSVPRNVFIEKKENFLKDNGIDLSHVVQVIMQTLHEFPLIVKPHDDGCSVMVQKVTNEDELVSALTQVLTEKDAVLIEECITGMELTVGIIGNQDVRALPPSQTISLKGILSIEEKFLPGAGENQTPAPLPQPSLECVQKTVADAYKKVGCKGYARIDCFYQSAVQSPTGQERVVILEINTLPGMTPATCLFHQAAEIGLKPMDFIDEIIRLGFEEHSPLMRNKQKQQEIN